MPPAAPVEQSRTRPPGGPPAVRSVIDLIGNTPMVELRAVRDGVPEGVRLYAKLEGFNPGGSVKDRPAKRMIEQGIADGLLVAGKTILDSTSGNTGIGLAMVGAALGYPVKLVMPENVSVERKKVIGAYGAEIVYSDPMEGSDGAIRLVRELVARHPDKYFYADQYSNPSNPLSHYHGTAVEILDAVGDRITHFVAGLGTTGTVMGNTRRLKEHTRRIHCVAVEPAEALHGLEGLKHLPSSIVPEIYDPALPDEVMPVTTDEGWDMADLVAAEEGLHVGHSTGANIFAAVRIAERLQKQEGGGCVVTIACDRGDRYFAPMKWEKRYVW